jgi:hypothetical protein
MRSEIYMEVLDIYKKKHTQRSRFASAVVTLGLADKSDWHLRESNDKLFTDLFTNCVWIEDGEAAFSRQELEEFWQEIEQAIVQMRQIVASQERS